MRISEEGLQHVKKVEGVRYVMYLDQAGLATIGVGHLLSLAELDSGKIYTDRSPESISWKNRELTPLEVDQILEEDLEIAEMWVEREVKVELTQGQFDALVSFVFNIGHVKFRKSTLLKFLNEGQYDKVPGQLRKWIYAGGKASEGLAKRREMEIKLWNKK